MDKPTMRGWILHSGSPVPELVRACEEARASGVLLDVIHPKEIDLILDPQSPARVFRKGAEIPLPQFAIASFVSEPDAYNFALLQQLETQGVLCVNRADTLKKTSDKLLTLQLLAAQGVPVPKTLWIRPNTSPDFLRDQLGLPLVVKIIDGSKGHGVSLVHSLPELETLLDMLMASRPASPLLAQEFLADSRGRDLRVLVIDGKPRVAMLRQNRSPDGFKSNISAGGRASAFPLSDPIRELSERVISILGLNIGGIDLLFRGDGFVVGEANSSPGFQGIESCTDVNVPVEVLHSIARQLQARAAARFQALAEGVRSLDDLRGRKEPELVQLCLSACASPDSIQLHVLLDILRRNANTQFGAAHGFASIRSIADFRRQVPVAGWEAFEPFAKRMEAGEPDVLFAGRPAHFIATSGTTGNVKLLPESPEGAFAKSLVSKARIALLMKMAPGVMDGFFIPLSNAASFGTTSGGIPFGFASGLTLAGASPDILRRMAFPPDVLQADDPETLDYLILRHAVAQPLVRLLVGNNPGRMTALLESADRHRDALLDDIERGTLRADLPLAPDLRARLERALSPDPDRARSLRALVASRGRLDPRDYWPGLQAVSCWLGGTIGRYLEGLKPWLPETVTFIDCGYGASEGKFNLPTRPGASEGPLALFGCFFEFAPRSGGEPLLAHELTDGEEYELLVTTYSGLYRYDLHDIVRVQGFTRRTPNLLFVGKSREIANLATEKLTGSFLADVVRQTLADRDLRWKHFGMVADSAQHRYVFCVEPDGPPPDAAWLAHLDQALIDQALAYKVMRGQKLILPPRLLVVKPGWRDQLYAARLRPGVTTAQIKLPMIYDQPPAPDLVERIVEM